MSENAPPLRIELLTVLEVATVLRVSERTVRSLLAQESLRPVRVGRRVFVDAIELERFINRGRKSPS